MAEVKLLAKIGTSLCIAATMAPVATGAITPNALTSDETRAQTSAASSGTSYIVQASTAAQARQLVVAAGGHV